LSFLARYTQLARQVTVQGGHFGGVSESQISNFKLMFVTLNAQTAFSKQHLIFPAAVSMLTTHILFNGHNGDGAATTTTAPWRF
jgi:hypothetical protein